MTNLHQSALTELRARVEAATGLLDRQTLAELICAVHGWKLNGHRIATGDDGSEEFVVNANGSHAYWNEYRSRCPDASVDAALVLVERVLPGWHWTVSSPFLDPSSGFYAALVNPQGTGGPEPWEIDHEMHEAQARSAPLAILAALLKALIAKAAP